MRLLPRLPRRRLAIEASCLGIAAVLLACSPGPGAIVLEAGRGSVVDRESGAPIVGADVYQVYWGRGVAGEPRPAYALRWTQTGKSGQFAFEETLSKQAKTWVLETDAAEYGFFHPDYGLVRGSAGSSPIELAGPPLDEAKRRAEELSLCGSRPADRVIADVARMHCSHPTRD